MSSSIPNFLASAHPNFGKLPVFLPFPGSFDDSVQVVVSGLPVEALFNF
jgi:hypothetical protein